MDKEIKAELLEIVAQFQEGFNTNLHCFELVQCICDYLDSKFIIKEK